MRRQERAPPLHRGVDVAEESPPVVLETVGEIGTEARERAHDVLRDDGHRAGIEREVRIAGRMDVAERAIDTSAAHLEELEPTHRFDHRRGATQHARVAAALDHRIDPRVLVEPVAHEDLRAAHEHDLARPDLEIVRILSGARGDAHLAGVADDRARDGPEVGKGGDDAERLRR